MHKISVLLISEIISFKSFNFHKANCFFTIGFSFQKIGGLHVFNKVSRLFGNESVTYLSQEYANSDYIFEYTRGNK